jgi:lipopolysaccharide biosynthesis regulator YciM
LRRQNRDAPKAYFKGLNYLLNEQQDQAIDAFIEAVQNDPDTSELHFALGNLFRRRGEYDRAVRVHEHLLSRGDLSSTDRDRAQHALALDYLKAGLLDRAEDALARLEGTAFEGEARLARLAIFERSRDWAQAAEVARKMHAAGQGDFSARQAHYLCEQAFAERAAGHTEAAIALLEQALRAAPQAARPHIELARLAHQTGDEARALDLLRALAAKAPSALPLAAALLTEIARSGGREAQVLALLSAHYAQAPSLDVLDAIVALGQTSPDAALPGTNDSRMWYLRHLEIEPSLVAAAKWLAGERLEHEAFHPQVQAALDAAARPLMRYRCAACGFEARQHFWHCPGCQAWDSYPAQRVEEL